MKNFKKIFGIFLGLAMCGTLAACGPKYDVESAKDIIFQNYKNTTSTTASYDLNCQVQIGEDFYPVTWDLTVAEGGDASCIELGTPANGVVTVTITRDKVVPAVDTEYTLHYVVTDPKGKNPLEGTFTRTVPAFKYATFEEIKAACDAANGSNTEETFDFKGIVVGKSSFSSGKVAYVYVDSGNGALCAYNLTCADEAAWEAMGLGAEIIVSGKAVLYQGTYEFAAGCTYELVKAAPATYTPHFFDLTTAFAAAHNVKTDLVNYQNRLVKLTGVTLGNIGSNNYQYFTLNGVETYLRCSSSSNYLTTAPGDNGTAFYNFFKNEWTKGYTADVAGILCCYSGTHYIMPVAATEDYYKVTNRELTPEVKVANTLEEVANTFEEEYVGNQEITLAAAGTTHPEVALTYAVKEGGTGEATINEGKLVVNGEKAGTVTVTVTATLGTVTDTKDVTFTVALPEPITIAKFLENKDKDNNQYVQGIVVAINGTSTKTGSFVIADKTGYLFSYDKAQVNVGDEVLVAGKYAVNGICPQIGGTKILATISQNNDITGTLNHTLDAAGVKEVNAAYGNADTKQATVDAYVTTFVKFTGFLAKSGDYYNVYDDANKTNQVFDLYSNNDISATFATLLGENAAVEVDVYGYVRGFGGGGRIQVQARAVVAKGGEFAVKPFEIDKNILLTGANLLGWKGSNVGYDNTQYKDSVVNGVTFSYKEVGSYDIGNIQWRYKGESQYSIIYTKTALLGDIEKVEFKWQKGKTCNNALDGIIKIEFANNADFTDATVVLYNQPVITSTEEPVFTITCPTEGCRYVRMSHTSVSGAVYFVEIAITCK